MTGAPWWSGWGRGGGEDLYPTRVLCGLWRELDSSNSTEIIFDDLRVVHDLAADPGEPDRGM
jgi:hypothetical protein